MRPHELARPPALLAAAIQGLLLVTSLYAMAVNLVHMPAGSRPGQVWAGVDFHTYLAAAVVAVRDGWTSLYDQEMVRAVQSELTPYQYTQAFLSPPPDALLVLPLTLVPYWVALVVWSAALLAALIFAFGWSSSYTGPARIAAVAMALAPWWVLLAVYVGQVVPIVAAAVVVAWHLARRNHDVAAGLVLSLIALKPNTAILVPFALLAAGRWRIFASWAAASGVITGASLLLVAAEGTGDYLAALGQLPHGATELTLGGAFGVSGAVAFGLRVLIAAVALLTARALRATPGLPMAAGALASLLVAPYLHNSDLCILVAAGWLTWEEAKVMRVPIASMWLAAAPFLPRQNWPSLEGWVGIELAFLAGLVMLGFARGRLHEDMNESSLTGAGELGRRAPA
jgi:hypothetical protein